MDPRQLATSLETWLAGNKHRLSPDDRITVGKAALALRFTDERVPLMVELRDRDLRAAEHVMRSYG
jgi:hypothetical protein